MPPVYRPCAALSANLCSSAVLSPQAPSPTLHFTQTTPGRCRLLLHSLYPDNPRSMSFVTQFTHFTQTTPGRCRLLHRLMSFVTQFTHFTQTTPGRCRLLHSSLTLPRQLKVDIVCYTVHSLYPDNPRWMPFVTQFLSVRV